VVLQRVDGAGAIPLIASAAKVVDEFLCPIAVRTCIDEITRGDPGELDYKAWEMIRPTLNTKKLPWSTLDAFCRGLATLQHELGVAAS